MSWQKEVDGLELRRRLALEHGGPEAVKQQQATTLHSIVGDCIIYDL